MKLFKDESFFVALFQAIVTVLVLLLYEYSYVYFYLPASFTIFMIYRGATTKNEVLT